MHLNTPRLPAEWEPQSAVMLTWPHEATDWAPLLDQTEPLYVELARQITRFETVLIVCHAADQQRHVQELLSAAAIPAESLRFGIAPSNDTWARDHGPITVLTADGPALLDFHFNGWGGKFEADLDDLITGELASQGRFGNCPRIEMDMILEGGALETDGAGTLLATESSVLSATRNPDLSCGQAEALLSRYLGCHRFLWLQHGQLKGDDTDGHIDTLARFCDRDTIVHVTCLPEDEDHAEIQAMIAELAGFRTAQGQPYRLIPLPAPQIHHDEEGRRLAASYANFLIINGAVLLPVYQDPADQAAIRCLAECFPGREIIPIDCRALIRQNGSLHCITMQLPAPLVLAAE